MDETQTTPRPATQRVNRTTHGACGKSWRQAGEKSGHCGGCHVTFYGSAAFDRHRRDRKCLNPAELPGPWWQDDDDQWHYGRQLTQDEKDRIWGGAA